MATSAHIVNSKIGSYVARLSTACQQLITCEFPTSHTARVVARSCLADTSLYPIIEGHKCNHLAICSSSLYADMACTIAKYIWQALRPRTDVPGLNVCDVEIPKSFIAQIPQPPEGQWLEIDSTAELLEDDGRIGGHVKCAFYSINPDGSKIDGLATCTVRYESIDYWREEWSRFSYMVTSQIKSLHERADAGDAHTFQRGLVYKLFKSFVDYSPPYRNMKSVVMDSSTNEATATIDFQTGPYDYQPPILLDGSCHVSGFICNASENLAEHDVFISHGWEGMKFSKPLSRNMKLTNYVRMQPKPDNVLQGDIYILEDGEIIAVWEGAKFKRIPRRVLEFFLPPPKEKKGVSFA